MTQDAFDVLLVTGMSGAGRSTAARALEDAGWFVIDNIPPMLIGAAIDVAVENRPVHDAGAAQAEAPLHPGLARPLDHVGH
ncbi:MAG: RNase adaptor protein RapZ, partial [Phycisphaeraceae bacterium]|nr:RNase adaptor protein RapZ [Phycisphaeraceae bacterium]